MAIDLSRVSKGRRTAAPLALVYGPEGSGKTTFCCGSDSALLLRAEKGEGDLDVARYPLDAEDGGTEVFQSFTELCDTLQAVHADPSYGVVVLDSMTAVERLIHQHVCLEGGVESIEKYEKGFGKGYRRAQELAWQLIEWARAIQSQGRAFLFIAHAEVNKFQDPEGEDYDQYMPRMHKQVREILTAQCEHVFFLNWKTFKTQKDEGFGKTSTTATGQQRMLYTAKRPAFYAKTRYSLPAEIMLPDDPSNPTKGWSVFMEAVAKAQS